MYVCTCTSACRLYLSVLQCVHVHVHIPQTFINYLQGVGDPGTRLLFKFRSGTNDLNEELGRHLGKNDDRQCKLCGDECENVVHVLWECPAYDTIRNTFMEDLDNLLG